MVDLVQTAFDDRGLQKRWTEERFNSLAHLST